MSVEPMTLIVLPEGTVFRHETKIDSVSESESQVSGNSICAPEEGLIINENTQGEENINIVICEDEEAIDCNEECIGESRIICTECKEQFLHEDDLDKHRDECCQIIYICTLCSENFATEDLLNSHYETHWNDDIACEQCGENFKFSEGVKSFKTICCSSPIGGKAIVTTNLNLCQDGKNDLDNEKSTQNTSKEEERFGCERCPRWFSRLGSLNYHVSRKHSGGLTAARCPSDYPFPCPACPNRYKSTTQLCRHRRWECGKEATFKCHLCPKKFHHRHGLKQHVQLHSVKEGKKIQSEANPYQFTCRGCGRGYKLKSSLNNHLRWECGKKPLFACHECNVKFTYKGNLKKHNLIKHREKTLE